MSDKRSIDQTAREITSKILLSNSIENIENNTEVNIDFERLLLQNLLHENDISSEATNKLRRHIRLEETKIIDAELESRLQDIERKLLQGYEQEEAKEERVLEGEDREYEGDFPEDYYYSSVCHEIVASNEISYDDCGGNSKSELNKGFCLVSPAENPKIVLSSSDELMKYNAFHTPIGQLARCNPTTCPYKGTCISKMSVDDIMEIKTNFWGPMDEEAPSRGTRRLAIIKLLQNAIHRQSKTFQFTFGGKEHSNSIVCEAAFLIALGLSNNPNASQASSMWINVKKWILEGYDLDPSSKYSYNKITAKKDSQQFEKESKRLKFDDASAFILFFAEEFGDRVASADSGDPDTLVVPFCTIASFYDEYKVHSINRQTPVECYAGQTVFTEAYDHLHKTTNIRKLKAKGTFNTCEICNNADTILKNKHKKLTPSQRDIIQKFRQLHLKQQSNERRFLDVKKLKAAQMDGNRPRAALIFPDFMTEYTCQTPKWPASSASDMKVDSRLLGIEVYCGPIKTVFIYRVDALVVGGADIMVECVRQAIIDLVKLLRQEGLLTPKALWLQFDNCGENKNKQMFAYASILVEDLYFDEVEICFLIVGHTHASIDQYFSMISHKIHNSATKFIGSPLGLLELVRQCHYNKYSQDPVIRDITVYYDVTNAFKPYINKNIKFYSIPHYFIFQRIFGRVSAMQSKMLSTSTLLLPQRPEKAVIDKDALLSLLLNDVPLPTSFALMDGLDAVKFHLMGSEKCTTSSTASSSNNNVRTHNSFNCVGETEIHEIDITTDGAFGNIEKSKNLLSISKLLPDLEAISGSNAVHQQECRMQDEAEGIIPKRSYQFREELTKKIRNVSKSEKGFICWLNINSKREELTPWTDIIKPEPFSPKCVLDKYFEIKTIVDSEEKDGVEDFDDEVEDEPELPSLLSESRLSHRNSTTLNRNTSSDINLRKTIPLEKRHKRLYVSSLSIAKTAAWVVKQVALGKMTVAEKGFTKDIFLKVPGLITPAEYNWYLARETVEKVLNVAMEEFRNAEPWEPFPSSKLSDEDQYLLQQEKNKQDKLDAEAVKLGETLLRRFTDTAKDTDQIVKYGINNNETFIKQLGENFKERRNTNNKVSSKPSEPKYYKCDLNNCQNFATDDSRCTTCTTTTYRFCNFHIAHPNHTGVGKRKKREQVTKKEFDEQLKNVETNRNNNNNKKNNDIDDNNSNSDNNNNNNNNTNISTDKKNNNIDDNNSDSDNNNNNNNTNNYDDIDFNNNNDCNDISINKNSSNISDNNNNNNNNDSSSDINSKTYHNIDNNSIKKIYKKRQLMNNNDNDNNIIINDINNDHCMTITSTKRSKIISTQQSTFSTIITQNSSSSSSDSNHSDGNAINNSNSVFSFIHKIITDDKMVDNCNVQEYLFKDELLFKNEKDPRYKIFVKIRNAVILGKKSEILMRIENLFIEWPSSTDDLKYLTTNIFNLELELNFDWKAPTALKNTLKRKEFVRAFAKAFVSMYCNK